MTAAYVPERDVVSLTWPHRDGTTSFEGVEFPATPEWLERMRPVLEAMARNHRAG